MKREIPSKSFKSKGKNLKNNDKNKWSRGKMIKVKKNFKKKVIIKLIVVKIKIATIPTSLILKTPKI